MKRSELISWLHDREEVGYEDKNPDIILSDGTKKYLVLSVYSNADESKKKPTIFIDIQAKD